MIEIASSHSACEPSARRDGRKRVAAKLMGSHTYTTLVGVEVHVWQRGGEYLARGRFQGQVFGETLGKRRRGTPAPAPGRDRGRQRRAAQRGPQATPLSRQGAAADPPVVRERLSGREAQS